MLAERGALRKLAEQETMVELSKMDTSTRYPVELSTRVDQMELKEEGLGLLWLWRRRGTQSLST